MLHTASSQQVAFKARCIPFTSSRPAVRPVSRGKLQVQNAIKEVFMPALSSTMTEGKVVSWIKSEGDAVKKGEAIVTIESDKADMDVESFNEGILAAVVVGEGDRANVGAPIAFIAETEAEVAEAKKKAAALGGAPAPAAEAAPAPAPAPAPAAPAAAAPPPPPPTTAAPAQPKAVASPAPNPPPPAAPAFTPRADGRVVATPYAKQLAKELKVDLTKIGGSGPNGRITASDVERAAGRGTSAPAPAAPTAAAAAAAPAPAAAKAAASAPAAAKPTLVSELKGTTKPFTTLQNAVTRNMMESLKVPEFRVAMSIQTDKLDALYQKLKPSGVTMTALLAKAVGVALAQHPIMYASITPDASGVTYNERVNVSMAVAMPDGGLITPVLQDADKVDIYQLSRNWADLVKRARSKQLKPEEYSSGTFAISNLGMFGVDTFDAILPPGHAGILAVGGSKPTVVATEDGMIGVRKVMTVNVTADHRLVYGAQAAEFLQTLKATIESPEQLLL